MQALCREEQQVGTTNVKVAKDRVHIGEQLPEPILRDVLLKNRCQCNHNESMIRNRTWAYRDLPIDELQPHSWRIFAELQELPSGHLDRADGHRDGIIPRNSSPHLMRRLRQII